MSNESYEILDNTDISRGTIKKTHLRCIKIVFLITIVFACGFVIGYLISQTLQKHYFESSDYEFAKLSRTLQQNVDVNFLSNQIKTFASEVHQAGSNRNLELAELVRNDWQQWGIQSAKIYKYPINKTVVNDNDPNIVRILVNNKNVHNLTTVELNGTLPLYHSYSVGGHAKGRLVFINYGLLNDLNVLDSLNVSYCGTNTIPIARLGFSARSAKVKNLVRKCGKNAPGALLLYPDPWDFSVDSNNKSSTPENTPVYPNSWWLPGDAAVFGNLKMAADLQNPELPSSDGIFTTVNFSKMQTPFPVQPVSYNDATQLFKHNNELAVPNQWKPCLPKYLKSSDPVQVEMIIRNQVDTVVMSNVIGWIPGTIDKDRYVILGNHRDAWAMGASDPVSGTVILQQVASILGNAYKKGLYKPFRSVIFANWDGEEEGLIGSAEFTNQFSPDLLQRCVAYINMDCPIKGHWSFNGRATPLMIGPMLDSAKNVFIENSGKSLFDDWMEKRPELPKKVEPKVSFLGGGSDHINFAYVLGIPSAYPEYTFNQSLANMPAYHTRYDNIDMMLRWVDPGLWHHKLISQFVLDYILRLSNSPLVPYSIDRLIGLMIGAFPDLKNKINSIPYLNQSNYSSIIEIRLEKLNDTSVAFSKQLRLDQSISSDPFKLRMVNDILLRLPRMFLTRDGLPTRPHLRNILLATKLTNSYQGSVFTGVFDAVDLFHHGTVDLTVVLRQLSLLANCLSNAINLLKGGLIKIFE